MDNLSGYIWKIDLVEIRLFPQATAEFECVRREKVWTSRRHLHGKRYAAGPVASAIPLTYFSNDA